MSQISSQQVNAYQEYCSKRDELLNKRNELKKELNQVEKELDSIRVQFKPLCFHPTKIYPTFNICGVCHDIIQKS